MHFRDVNRILIIYCIEVPWHAKEQGIVRAVIKCTNAPKHTLVDFVNVSCIVNFGSHNLCL